MKTSLCDIDDVLKKKSPIMNSKVGVYEIVIKFIRACIQPLFAVMCFMVTFPVYAAVDWSAVKGQDVLLFYPGQGSWEWSLTQDDHSGAKKFREGKNCKACHESEQKDIGAKIVSGKKLEPIPLSGKSGHLPVNVKVARDSERIYFRFEWQGAKLSNRKKMEPKIAARVTVMLDDGSVKEATRAGCWGSCHDDAIGMASAPAGKEISKYLLASRSKVTRQGGGENFKSSSDIEKLLKQGIFLEYWQAQLNPGQPAHTIDGYILDQRHENKTSIASTEATHDNGKWIVVLSRKLRVGSAVHAVHKDIAPGKTYSFGIAVHDDFTNHRFHYVSLEYSLALDAGSADFVVLRK